MRIVIVDDEGPAIALKALAETAAGVEVAAADVVPVGASSQARGGLEARLEASPPPALVLAHVSVLGSEDAEAWLRNSTAEQTLVITYSDGMAGAHAEDRLWRCHKGVVKDHLPPFLETCLGLVETGWPGNVRLEQLVEGNGQGIAMRHAAELCHALADVVLEGAIAPDAVLGRWAALDETLKRAALVLVHMPAALVPASAAPAVAPRYPVVEALRIAFAKPDERTILEPLLAVSGAIKAEILAGNTFGARGIVVDLEQMLARATGLRP
jgi:hypothetical protein